METKTLAELWNGNLAPIRNLGKNNEELKHLETLIERNCTLLEDLFNDGQHARWEIFSSCMEEYISLLCEQAFCDGFCLGTKITAEALGD